MRRTSSRRLFAAAVLAASVLAPVTLAPAAAGAVRGTAADRHHRHDRGDCPHSSLDRATTARLDRAIADVQQQAGIPGLVVGLWMPGKGNYLSTTGVQNTATGKPMSPDLFMRIGSETKTFTVTALLQLVDEHRVRLDDPISRYVSGVPDGRHITLRQLAEMRSGLFPYTSDPDFVHDLLSDPQRQFTPREVLAYGFKHANTFAPGAQFEYSNTNLVLLGLVVEKAGGARVADFVQRHVLRPAGLGHTLFPRAAEFPEPHAHGYTNQTLSGAVEDSTDWNPSWAWSAGAMISNLDDLHRWARVVATGTLISPEAQRQRLKFLPTGHPGTSYGLGIFDSGGWIGHNGSIPGYESVTVYLPSKKATLVVLLNTDVTVGGQEPSSLVARAVTQIVTPDHVYDAAAPTR
ncbi:serine hydrolase domain-containing protein [Streptomyces mangrovisoli]|uniref:Serine hydrolase n=1 Tax=Streptomyces mangrovisoli TaxID=1428628 RepID=A0A1J4NZ26_9ACTN|nr:serine hydrolase domain-containing protein [Streptomyces mangrovisoli]OIJ66430.1 serine hydrolase [Streptomyces mangrovisoli]